MVTPEFSQRAVSGRHPARPPVGIVALGLAVVQSALGIATTQWARHRGSMVMMGGHSWSTSGVTGSAIAVSTLALFLGGLSIGWLRRLPWLPAVAAPVFTSIAWIASGQPVLPGLMAPFATVLLLLSTGRRNAGFAAAGLTWTMLVATACGQFIADRDGHGPPPRTTADFATDIAPALILLTLALGIAVTGGLALAGRRERLERLAAQQAAERLAQEERDRAHQARAEATRVHAADEERMRIARDLHDTVGHALSVINVQASVTLHLLDTSTRDDAATRDALAAIKDVSKQALVDVRGVLNTLRTSGDQAPKAPDPGLLDVETLLTRVRAAGLDIDAELTTAEVPAVAGSVAYRVIQESLTNVLRHAHATRVRVRVSHEPGSPTLLVSVSDDGEPNQQGAAVPASGQGIPGMRHRVEDLGGTFHAAPTAQGFHVTAVLPLDVSLDPPEST